MIPTCSFNNLFVAFSLSAFASSEAFHSPKFMNHHSVHEIDVGNYVHFRTSNRPSDITRNKLLQLNPSGSDVAVNQDVILITKANITMDDTDISKFDGEIANNIENELECTRGICVTEEEETSLLGALLGSKSRSGNKSPNFIESILSSYLGPRILLASACILYGTNFALLSFMNTNLPPSAVAADRFFLASMALSPYLLRLKPNLRWTALGSGFLCTIGFVSQAISLNLGTPASTVAFMAAFAVVVCPLLEAVVKGAPMTLKSAPQTYLSALLCLTGVGVLELYDPVSHSFTFSQLGMGDFWALIQAFGFGACWFVTEELVKDDFDQVIPVTAVQLSTMAFFSMLWAFYEGNSSTEYGVIRLFTDPSLVNAAEVVFWTGVM